MGSRLKGEGCSFPGPEGILIKIGEAFHQGISVYTPAILSDILKTRKKSKELA